LTGVAVRAWLGPTLEGFVLFAIAAGASYGWFLVRYGRTLRLDQLLGALRRRSGASG
jgi:hypothetical protein